MRLEKNLKFNDDKRDWLGKNFDVHDWQDSEPLKVISNEIESGNEYKDKLREANQKWNIARRNSLNKLIKSDLYDQTQDVRNRTYDEWSESQA